MHFLVGRLTVIMTGLEIKIARIRAGIKQYELAASLGISQNQLSLIELGRRQPSPELPERILSILESSSAFRTQE